MKVEDFEAIVPFLAAHLVIDAANAMSFAQRLAHVSEISESLICFNALPNGDETLRDRMDEIALDVAVCLATPNGNPDRDLSSWRMQTSWLHVYSADQILAMVPTEWRRELDIPMPAIEINSTELIEWLRAEGKLLRQKMGLFRSADSALRVVSILWFVDVVLSRIHLGLTKCRPFVR